MIKLLLGLFALTAPFAGAFCAQEGLESTSEEISIDSSQDICLFTPPSGWDLADASHLSPRVLIGFVGKTKKGFCPSINLAVEEINVTQKEYIKAVKALHETDRNNRWRELGKVKTHSGMASLTEIDTKTESGSVRILQLILVKEGHAYILTAAALKEEFSGLYQEFHDAFRSLALAPDLFAVISQPQKKESLKMYRDKLTSFWKDTLSEKKEVSKELFANKEFQEKYWLPFQNYVTKECLDLGTYWQVLMLKSAEQEFFAFEIESRRGTDSCPGASYSSP